MEEGGARGGARSREGVGPGRGQGTDARGGGCLGRIPGRREESGAGPREGRVETGAGWDQVAETPRARSGGGGALA